MNRIALFNSWKSGFFRDSKQNTQMATLIPFALKNVNSLDLREDPIFQFFLLFNQTWLLENLESYTEETLQSFNQIEKRMNLVWKCLREKKKKTSKTPKFHDFMHKVMRIKLFGPTSITSTRGFEKMHYSYVKMAFLLTNRKNVIPQLINQVITLFIRFFFQSLFLFQSIYFRQVKNSLLVKEQYRYQTPISKNVFLVQKTKLWYLKSWD